MVPKIKTPSHYRFTLCWLLSFIFLMFAVGIAKANLPAIMDENDIPPYLVKMIAWHKLTASLEISPDLPREVLLKEQLQQHADKALASSFDFAHDLAGLAETAPKPAADKDAPAQPPAKGRNIFKTIAGIEQQISTLKSGLANARTAQTRIQLTGKLQLAEEDLVLFRSIAENLDTSDEENNNLDQKIRKLEATVPELNGQPQKAAPVLPEQNASGSSGIFGLLTEIYNSLQAKADIKSLIGNTTDIRTDSRKYSLAARDGVKDILRQGNSIGQPTAINTPPVTYDSLLTDMKKLTKVTIAASGVGLSSGTAFRTWLNGHELLSQHVKDLSSRIFFRLCTLLLAVGGALSVSALIGKALPRYVPDERRCNQLLTIKKIILSIVLGLMVFLGFFTDLSSLGTFIGLLTAGLAVALQNVILSMIAYFQFFGSFGLKNGDRITISGVTGKVMKIGMLRFYLMEMKESDMGYLPTGRAVGFSNSILFQPMPFFRQTPGTNFVWNEIVLTLDPTIDHQDAYKKINAAVERIYAKHHTAMQKQQTSLQKLAQFKAEVSVPQIYLKITGTGLLLVIRYAVEREQASTLHLQLTEELLGVIKKDPVLKIVNIG